MEPLTETFEPLPVMETIAEPPRCLETVEWIESTVPRRLSSVEYKNIVSDVFGLAIDSLVNFPPDEETMGFDNNARALQASPIHIERYFEAAEVIAHQAVSMITPQLDCDLNGVDPACLELWLSELGMRLWRRPLSVSELERFRQLFQEGIETDDTENSALARVLEALLQSPFFLYRVEVGTETVETGIFELTDYEIASRLSFLTWRAGPDAALLDAASTGALRTSAGRLEQLDRLLGDPRAERAWWSFFAQWLHFDDLLTIEKDKGVHPNFNSVRREQYEQARAFTQQHGFANGASFFPDHFRPKAKGGGGIGGYQLSEYLCELAFEWRRHFDGHANDRLVVLRYPTLVGAGPVESKFGGGKYYLQARKEVAEKTRGKTPTCREKARNMLTYRRAAEYTAQVLARLPDPEFRYVNVAGPYAFSDKDYHVAVRYGLCAGCENGQSPTHCVIRDQIRGLLDEDKEAEEAAALHAGCPSHTAAKDNTIIAVDPAHFTPADRREVVAEFYDAIADWTSGGMKGDLRG